jgi:hypothetical protein
MVEVARDRLVERRQFRIDQQMMVACVGLLDACRRHTHVDQAEANRRMLGNDRTIVQANEIDLCVSRRRRARR